LIPVESGSTIMANVMALSADEFKNALPQRITRTLLIHAPKLSPKPAADIAITILLNVKAVATHRPFSNPRRASPLKFAA
jgi:hypothetical protein